MARKRKRSYFARRAAPKRAYFKRRRSGRRSSSGSGNVMKEALITGLYGAGRGYLSGIISPVTSKLGIAGVYADNVALAGSAFLVGKFMPSMKKYTNKVIIAEALLAGMKAGSGMTSVASPTTQVEGVYS